MSQLHQEALRRQVVVDKRNMTDLSLLLQKEGSANGTRRKSCSSQSTSSASMGRSLQGGSRNREVIITDPYLDAITNETRARTQNRFSSTDYMMQW